MSNFYPDYLRVAIHSFGSYKKLADRAIEQVCDEEFFTTIDAESNSIAIIVRHIAGNMHSRWKDFLETDGEKPDRNRDKEFELIMNTRESLLEFWESGWQTLFEAIEPLKEEDFSRTIKIRGEPHTVVEAINRQLTHYSYHIGQIVFLAKHLKANDWKNLSVARNLSGEYNQHLADQKAAEIQEANRIESAVALPEGKNDGPEKARGRRL